MRVADLWVPVHLVVNGPDSTQDDLHGLGGQAVVLWGQLQQLMGLHFLRAPLVQEVHNHTAEQAGAFIRHGHHANPMQQSVHLQNKTSSTGVLSSAPAILLPYRLYYP